MIIYVGSLVNKETEEEYSQCSKTPIPQSSNNHQYSIIEGMRNYTEVFVINRLPFGSFPSKTNRMTFSRQKFDFLINVKCNNIPVVRSIQQVYVTYKEVEEILRTEQVEAIVGYMPFWPRMFALCLLKNKYPEIAVLVIAPDLVRHSYPKSGKKIRKELIKVCRYIEDWMVNRLARGLDGFIYLTNAMHLYLGKQKKYIVQEAIYSNPVVSNAVKKEDNLFVFTYCGKINDENGVERLIGAFSQISETNARLILCGTGEDLEKYKCMAKDDNRILFTGQLSHEKVIEHESKSDVLINPRYTYLENASFSFPSKLIEYLACGKAVISSRLAGITEDYNEYLFYIKDDSTEALKDVMVKLMNLQKEELERIGEKNRSFVEKEKSSLAQGKKMYDFIVDICNEIKVRDEKNEAKSK